VEKDIESIFDLEIGDRVRHGRNFGIVTKETPRGPEIEWDYGLIDYQYTEELHKAHPLHLSLYSSFCFSK